jgi:hypothetical protein
MKVLALSPLPWGLSTPVINVVGGTDAGSGRGGRRRLLDRLPHLHQRHQPILSRLRGGHQHLHRRGHRPRRLAQLGKVRSCSADILANLGLASAEVAKAQQLTDLPSMFVHRLLALAVVHEAGRIELQLLGHEGDSRKNCSSSAADGSSGKRPYRASCSSERNSKGMAQEREPTNRPGLLPNRNEDQVSTADSCTQPPRRPTRSAPCSS